MEQQFTRTAMLMHWFIGLMLLAQFGFGWLLDGIARNTPARGYFINLHKSTGLVIGVLILLRIGWRLTHQPPRLPLSMPHWERRVAKITHLAMYACMLLMPLSGYLASNFSKHGIKFFNVVKWAPWGQNDKALYLIFNLTHKVTAVLFAALITLHLLAVVKHALIDRDHFFARMWPRLASRN